MRKLTPYEINLLYKNNFSIEEVELNTDFQKGKPVEFFAGFSEFRRLQYKISQNTLIPRIETEKMVDLALEWLNFKKRFSRTLVFADVGTGSGAIGISFGIELLKKNIKFKAYMVDKSKEAVEVCQYNAKNLLKDKLSDIKILNSNLLDSVSKLVKFDVIFANLPYIPTSRIEFLDNSVKDFEPIIALDGGVDGFFVINELLAKAKKQLSKNGIIILEVDDTHNMSFLKKFYKKYLDIFDINIVKDFNNKTRFWVCTHLKHV